jgi:glycolate oxidase FAD binding subunit
MQGSLESLITKLEQALDAGSVRSDSAGARGYAVEGKTPALVCSPPNAEQLGAAVRIAGETGASVIPWGGGTMMRLGNPPKRFDIALTLERLDKLVEHDDANLTAIAQAGVKIAELQRMLVRGRQFLALDPPNPDQATIGGVVSANSIGPRRMAYGAVRDQVIGMKVVLADGTSIKAGGKVVKNVAGYDLCKLFVGSLGTLGIITEVGFRLAPIAESAATVLASGSLAHCLRFARGLLDSPLLPVEIAITNRVALDEMGSAPGDAAVAVWSEGFAESVERHVRDVPRLAAGHDLATQVFRNGDHMTMWKKLRDFGVGQNEVLYRLTVPLAAVAPALTALDGTALLAAPARALAFAATGTIRLVTEDGDAPSAVFPKLLTLAREHSGHAVVEAAPPALKGGVDVWGPSPQSWAIMRKLKRRFDPSGTLNPGRLIGGL